MVRDGAVQSLAGNFYDGQALEACKDFIPRMQRPLKERTSIKRKFAQLIVTFEGNKSFQR